MSFKSKEQQRKCYIMTARDQAGSWNCKAWSKSASFRCLPERKKAAAWVVANYLKYAASLRPELSRGYEKAAKEIFSGSNLPKAIKRAFPTLKVLQVTKLSKLIIDSAADAQRLSKRASCGVGPTGSKIIKIRKKKPVSAKVTIVKKMAEDMEKEAFWGALLKALSLGGKALKAVPMATRGAATAARNVPKIMKGVDKGRRLSTLRGAFNVGSRGGNVGRVLPKGGVVLGGPAGVNLPKTMAEAYGAMGSMGQMGWALPGAAAAGGVMGSMAGPAAGGYNDNYSSTGGGYDANGQYHGVSDSAANYIRSNPSYRLGPTQGGFDATGNWRNYGQEQWRNGGGGGRSNAYQDGMRDGRQSFKIKQLKRRKKRLQSKLKPPTAPAPAAPAPAAPAAVASPSTRGGPLYAGEPAAAARLNA